MASQPQNVQCITLDADTDNAGYPKTLLRKLYDASLIGEDTDVVLVFGKFGEDASTVHVHSSILKSESSFFKAWMSSECWNNELIKSADGKTMISLPADDPEEFKSFLKLMYGQKGLIKKAEIHKEAIPAFKIADKYGALDVMRVCEKECFPVLNNNFENLNVAQVYTFAQKYGVTSVTDAVFAYVKKNPMEALVNGKHALDWTRSGEEVLLRLLSTDSYYPSSLSLSAGWSANEIYLCSLASRWLKNRKNLAVEAGQEEDAEEEKEEEEDSKEGPSPKRARVTETEAEASATAVRVLQNIRFLQIGQEHLKSCLLDLKDLLTPHQIGTICMVWAGVPQDVKSAGERGDFIVNTRLRRIFGVAS